MPGIHPELQRYKLNELCRINKLSCLVETDGGHAIIQPDMKPYQGAMLLVAGFGQLFFATLSGEAFITQDGEVLEGDVLDDVIIQGVMTFFINGTGAFTDENPVM